MSHTEKLFGEFLKEQGFTVEDVDPQTNDNIVYEKNLVESPTFLNQIYRIRIVMGRGNYMVIYKIYNSMKFYGIIPPNDTDQCSVFPVEEPVYRGLIPASFDLLKDIYHLCLDEIMRGELNNTHYLNASSGNCSQGYPRYSNNDIINSIGMITYQKAIEVYEANKKQLEDV